MRTKEFAQPASLPSTIWRAAPGLRGALRNTTAPMALQNFRGTCNDSSNFNSDLVYVNFAHIDRDEMRN